MLVTEVRRGDFNRGSTQVKIMNSLPQQPNTYVPQWPDRKPGDAPVKQAAADGQFALIEQLSTSVVYGYYYRGTVICPQIEPTYKLIVSGAGDINCTCIDHMGRGRQCKHIVALRLQIGGGK